MSVYISSGTGAGQVRTISDYNGTSKLTTVSSAWTTNPDNSSVYRLLSDVTLNFSDLTSAGTAKAGSTSTTVHLDAGASSPDDTYNNMNLYITS